MPALAHNLARTLLPRDASQFEVGTAPNSFSKNSLIYTICLGGVPVIILICIVIWALCFYGRNRTCCCCCTKRKDTDEQRELKERDTDSRAASSLSSGSSGLPSIMEEEQEARAPCMRGFA